MEKNDFETGKIRFAKEYNQEYSNASNSIWNRVKVRKKLANSFLR